MSFWPAPVLFPRFPVFFTTSGEKKQSDRRGWICGGGGSLSTVIVHSLISPYLTWRGKRFWAKWVLVVVRERERDSLTGNQMGWQQVSVCVCVCVCVGEVWVFILLPLTSIDPRNGEFYKGKCLRYLWDVGNVFGSFITTCRVEAWTCVTSHCGGCNRLKHTYFSRIFEVLLSMKAELCVRCSQESELEKRD